MLLEKATAPVRATWSASAGDAPVARETGRVSTPGGGESDESTLLRREPYALLVPLRLLRRERDTPAPEEAATRSSTRASTLSAEKSWER